MDGVFNSDLGFFIIVLAVIGAIDTLKVACLLACRLLKWVGKQKKKIYIFHFGKDKQDFTCYVARSFEEAEKKFVKNFGNIGRNTHEFQFR